MKTLALGGRSMSGTAVSKVMTDMKARTSPDDRNSENWPRSTRSPSRREELFDFIHQRMRQARLAQFGKVFEDDGLPGLVILHPLLVAEPQIERLRLVIAIEEHERVRAVRVKPNQIWSKRNSLIR